MTKKEKILFALGVTAFCIFLVFYVKWVANKDWLFDLSEKGSIGDAIGGITAPVIGIIGAILVYLSFMKQVEANKLITEQNEYRLIFDLINELKKDVQLLYDNKWKGSKTITDYFKNIIGKEQITTDIGRHFNYVLSSCIYIYKRIIRLPEESKEKQILFGALFLLYDNYLKYYCDKITEKANDETRSEIKNMTYIYSVELSEYRENYYNNNDSKSNS